MNVSIAECLYIDLSFVASMIDLMAPTRCYVNAMVKNDLKMCRTEVHQPLNRSFNIPRLIIWNCQGPFTLTENLRVPDIRREKKASLDTEPSNVTVGRSRVRSKVLGTKWASQSS
jgi:hypothetical protein